MILFFFLVWRGIVVSTLMEFQVFTRRNCVFSRPRRGLNGLFGGNRASWPDFGPMFLERFMGGSVRWDDATSLGGSLEIVVLDVIYFEFLWVFIVASQIFLKRYAGFGHYLTIFLVLCFL